MTDVTHIRRTPSVAFCGVAPVESLSLRHWQIAASSDVDIIRAGVGQVPVDRADTSERTGGPRTMTQVEEAADAEYWRRCWWHDRRRAYRHRWNMLRFDAHCLKCGQDAMVADDDCPCWKMRLPRQKEDREP